jgi:hypothetical protein
MMLLSRFWYAILAVAFAGAFGLVYVSIHEHNRLRESDTRAILDHDRDVVDWYLRLDAQRRLSLLAIASHDDAVRNGIVKAGAAETISTDVRAPLDKRLDELAQKYGAALKDEGKGGKSPTMLFAVDGRGRVVGAVNFDRAKSVKVDTFELGGFPIVADALHGWMRDDTWVLDREAIYRVVARPVVAAEGAGPVGAIVALRRVDDSYARLISDRTGAPVLFYVLGGKADGDEGGVKIAARSVPDKADFTSEALTPDAKLLADDKAYVDLGVSGLKTVPGKQGMTYAFARMIGAAWDAGAGFMVARKVTPIVGPSELLAGADESDKGAVPVPIVAAVGVAAFLLGLLATVFEHSMPTRRLTQEAAKLAKGEQDALPLPKLSGPMRKIGQDVNDGIERILAKGGGASRKAADLQQILGPVPDAPQMSAFSFGLAQDAGAQGSGARANPSAGIDEAFAGIAAPAAAAPPRAAAAAAAAPASAPKPPPPGRPAAPPPGKPAAPQRAPVEEDDDEATMVAKIPDELLRASATGEQRAIDSADELIQWKGVFEEFVAMRKRCNEPTSSLSFEKFQLQLRKNKDALVKQYGCRRVKFTVYEKDGKAALKATPIRE